MTRNSTQNSDGDRPSLHTLFDSAPPDHPEPNQTPPPLFSYLSSPCFPRHPPVAVSRIFYQSIYLPPTCLPLLWTPREALNAVASDCQQQRQPQSSECDNRTQHSPRHLYHRPRLPRPVPPASLIPQREAHGQDQVALQAQVLRRPCRRPQQRLPRPLCLVLRLQQQLVVSILESQPRARPNRAARPPSPDRRPPSTPRDTRPRGQPSQIGTRIAHSLARHQEDRRQT